jgi:hypothetical protein
LPNSAWTIEIAPGPAAEGFDVGSDGVREVIRIGSEQRQALSHRGRTQLRQLAAQLGAGQLHVPVAANCHLADAARALAQATGLHAGGAISMTP